MDSVALIQRLLNEVAEHLQSNLKPGRRKHPVSTAGSALFKRRG